MALAAGCATGSSAPPAPVADAPSCTADAVLGTWSYLYDLETDEPSPEATPGAVPDGFEPVDVVVCDLEERGDDGEVSALVMHEVWLTGDLAPLLRELDRPSQREDPGDPDCELAYPTPDLWLVAADGRAVLASQPTDECGWSRLDVDGAVRGLRETHRVEHPLREAED